MAYATSEVTYKSFVVSEMVVFCHRAVSLAAGVPCSTCSTLLHEEGGGGGLYLSQSVLQVTVFSVCSSLAEGLLPSWYLVGVWLPSPRLPQ